MKRIGYFSIQNVFNKDRDFMIIAKNLENTEGILLPLSGGVAFDRITEEIKNDLNLKDK